MQTYTRLLGPINTIFNPQLNSIPGKSLPMPKYRKKPVRNPVKPKPPVIVPKPIYTGSINDMMDIFNDAGVKFKE